MANIHIFIVNLYTSQRGPRTPFVLHVTKTETPSGTSRWAATDFIILPVTLKIKWGTERTWGWINNRWWWRTSWILCDSWIVCVSWVDCVSWVAYVSWIIWVIISRGYSRTTAWLTLTWWKDRKVRTGCILYGAFDFNFSINLGFDPGNYCSNISRQVCSRSYYSNVITIIKCDW